MSRISYFESVVGIYVGLLSELTISIFLYQVVFLMSFTYKNDLVASLVSRYNIILIMQVRQNMFRLSVSKSCPFLIHDLSLGFSQVTWWVPLMEQELLNLPEHMNSVFPRFTASNYPFGIFNFSCNIRRMCQWSLTQ